MTSSCDFDRLGFSDISAHRWWTPNALSARRRSALTLSMGSRSGVPVGVRLIVRPAAPATGSPAAPSSNCPLQPPSREENRRTPIALQLLESLCYIFVRRKSTVLTYDNCLRSRLNSVAAQRLYRYGPGRNQCVRRRRCEPRLQLEAGDSARRSAAILGHPERSPPAQPQTPYRPA